jgi:hypothetical protein
MNKHMQCTAAKTTALMTFEILVVVPVVSLVIAILFRNYVSINLSKPIRQVRSVGAAIPRI